MRKTSMMFMALPVMPFMVMARMARSKAWCDSGPAKTAGTCEGRANHEDDRRHPASESAPRARNVVETAQAAGIFSSLLGALRAARLDAALEGAGPFTVFAPSDDAFAKVPAEALQGLLSNPEELARVLKFHVVSGRLTSAELLPVGSLRTLEGRTLSLDLAQGGKVGSARVVKADVLCANGVIHVIDSVLLPS